MSSKLVIGNVNLFPYTGSAAIEGDLTVSGILTAKEHHNIIVSSSISYASGSHKFGDSADDLHQVTGSMMVTGTLSGTIVSGTFYGDGSNLTGIGGGGGGTPSLPLNSIQYNDAASFGGSANLTYDGSNLTNSGSLYLSSSAVGVGIPLLRIDHLENDGDNPILFVTGSGHIGIGTAAPSYALQIADDTNAFLVESEGGSDWFSVAGGTIAFNQAGGITKAGGVNLGQRFNIVDAFGTVGVLGLGQYPGSPHNVMEVNSSHLDNGGDWFVIDQSGSVGIGVTDPLALLHISGSDGTDAFRIDTQGATDNPAIFVSGSNSYVGIGTDAPSQGLHVKDNGGGQIVSRIEGSAGRAVLQVDNGTNYTFFGASSTGLDFAAGGSGAYSSPQMILRTSGKIGINVTDPDSQLEVSGTGTQQKWSYDADSYVTMTVADDSHTTIASGESGDITIDATTLYVTGSTQHLGGVNGREVGLGTFSGGGTVDWDASLGEYAFVKVSGSAAIDIKIINMEESMTLKLLVKNNGLDPGLHNITLSGTTTSTGTNGISMAYANGAPNLMIADTDSHLSVEMVSFSDGFFEIGNNFYA